MQAAAIVMAFALQVIANLLHATPNQGKQMNSIAPRIFALTLSAAMAMTLAAGSAHADASQEFLKSLEGSYSGRGVARILGEEQSKVSCRISSTFDNSASRLSMNGECAGTQGKGNVSGGVTANNGKLSGTFVSPGSGMKVTRSSGQVNGQSMVLATTLFDERAGKLLKVRQVVRRTGSGIEVSFFTFNEGSGKYENSGGLNLRRR